jgi:hypothetical protein
MSSMIFSSCLDTSHHGPPHPFKDAGVVVGSLTGILCDGEVPLHCQQEPHTNTQEFSGVSIGINQEDSNLASAEAMQCVLLYLSIGRDRCY